MQDVHQSILRTDVSGMPLEWIQYQTAVRLYYTDQVVYTCGSELAIIHGGLNTKTGKQSKIQLHSIIATQGCNQTLHQFYVPSLNNPTLFKRDANLCMYCGNHFNDSKLSRDHIHPIVKGGEDTWMNVITACKKCNNLKAGRSPEEAGMPLLAVPFQPTYAEYVYLKGKNILADQMDFLRAHFPRTSPLLERL